MGCGGSTRTSRENNMSLLNHMGVPLYNVGITERNGAIYFVKVVSIV